MNKAEKFIILYLGKWPDKVKSANDIESEAKAYGINHLKLVQAYNSLEYREDKQKNRTDLIRQVSGMSQDGDFGFKLTQRGRLLNKKLRGKI